MIWTILTTTFNSALHYRVLTMTTLALMIKCCPLALWHSAFQFCLHHQFSFTTISDLHQWVTTNVISDAGDLFMNLFLTAILRGASSGTSKSEEVLHDISTPLFQPPNIFYFCLYSIPRQFWNSILFSVGHFLIHFQPTNKKAVRFLHNLPSETLNLEFLLLGPIFNAFSLIQV